MQYSTSNRTRSSASTLIVLLFLLRTWRRAKKWFWKGDSIALEITKQTDCSILSNLNFETHHNDDGGIVNPSEPNPKVFKPCDVKYKDYTPCQEQDRAMMFPRENMVYRERHCPADDEKLRCQIPAPKGYMTPFPWPKSRDYAHYEMQLHHGTEKSNWMNWKQNLRSWKEPSWKNIFSIL